MIENAKFKKIMVIGCPGSGKSTLARELNKILEYPVLHLDYVFHIDNHKNIGREELKKVMKEFAERNDTFIVDGNYSSTMEFRMQFCDSIIFFDLPTEVCIENVLKRKNQEKQSDMAPGFDISINDEILLGYIRDFKNDNLEDIEELMNRNKHLQVIRLKSYDEKKRLLEGLIE